MRKEEYCDEERERKRCGGINGRRVGGGEPSIKKTSVTPSFFRPSRSVSCTRVHAIVNVFFASRCATISRPLSLNGFITSPRTEIEREKELLDRRQPVSYFFTSIRRGEQLLYMPWSTALRFSGQAQHGRGES